MKSAYPHYCLDSIFIEKFPFLRGFLDTIHKPGTGNPISIKLVTRHYLKQLLLLICHETYKARNKEICSYLVNRVDVNIIKGAKIKSNYCLPASTTWSNVGNLCFTADEMERRTKIKARFM